MIQGWTRSQSHCRLPLSARVLRAAGTTEASGATAGLASPGLSHWAPVPPGHQSLDAGAARGCVGGRYPTHGGSQAWGGQSEPSHPHPRLHRTAGLDSRSSGCSIRKRRKEGRCLDGGRSGVRFRPPCRLGGVSGETQPSPTSVLLSAIPPGGIPRSVQADATSWIQPVSKPEVLVLF